MRKKHRRWWWGAVVVVAAVTFSLVGAKVWRHHRERQYVRALRELQRRGAVLVVEVQVRSSWLDSLPGWLPSLVRHVLGPSIGARVGLDLSGVEIGDAVLTQVNRVKDLAWMRLSGTQINDAGLARLRGLRTLEFLDASGTLVTDRALAALVERLPKLAVVVGAQGTCQEFSDRLNGATCAPARLIAPADSGE